MKASAWLVLALASLALGAGEPTAQPAAQPTAEPAAAPKAEKPAEPAAEVAEPGRTVQMVELMLPGRTVEGRLVFEDDALVRVEAIGSGVIGYARGSIRDLRRFTISASAFQERHGDHYHGRAWEAEDAPAEFARARQAYQRALLAAETDEDRARLKSKLDVLAADRDEWQQEALRAQQLDLARHEVELAVLEKELTREKISALQRQEQELQALRAAVQRMQTDGQVLARMVEALQADLLNLEDEVDDLDDLDNLFVRTNVFVDLRREHERLEREVQRISRNVEQK